MNEFDVYYDFLTLVSYMDNFADKPGKLTIEDIFQLMVVTIEDMRRVENANLHKNLV